MVDTITPVVHGGNRRRWAGTVVLHVAGATVSAATLGAALGGVGAVLGAPWGLAGAVLVAVIALLYLARETVELPVPVLDARRQVPQWWRETFPPGATAFLYGLGLGVGFATHLRHGTLVAVAAAVVAGGDPAAGAVALGAFGAARSIAVAVTWIARDRESARTLTAHLERVAVGPAPRVANAVALGIVAAAAVWGGGSAAPGEAAIVPPVALTVAFGWAAAAKLMGPAAWRGTVDAHSLPPPVRVATLVAVPGAEAAVPVLILVGSIHAAAGLALVLLVVFSIALIRLRRTVGDRVPCGCFGPSRTRNVRLLLARNLGLAIIATAALAGPDWILGVAAPAGSDVVPAALATGGAVLAVVMARRAAALLRDARPVLRR
jgi:hypothetical protein